MVENRPAKRQRLNPSVEVGLMRDGSGRESASFVGSASGIHFIRSVYGALNAKAASAKLTGETPESNIVPGEDDRLEGNAAPSQRFCEPGEVNSGSTSFTFEDLLDWTGTYFDIWHPLYPFLHAPTILQNLETLSCRGMEALHTLDQVIIRTVLSIGLADRRQTSNTIKPVPRHLVFGSFDESLNSIQAVMTKPASIQALQAAVCVQLFLVSMLRLNGASKLGGLIIRTAFQLGLHRCPIKYTTFKTEEQQLRRRLFWSIYCIDRHICQALGLPLSLRDDDVDVCYPDNEKHSTQGNSGTQSNTDICSPSGSSEQDGRLRLMTLLTKHAQIRGLIIELRNKRVEERGETWDKAVSIKARLTQWWNHVEDSIEQAEMDDMPLSSLHRTVLEILKHESVISLNRPLLASSKISPNYAAALQSCIAASKSIIRALSTLTPAVPSFDSPHASRELQTPMFWPSFTWSVWMSAFIILYAACENEIDNDVAIRHTDRALQLLRRLAARGSVWPEACGAAIFGLRSSLDDSGHNHSLDHRDLCHDTSIPSERATLSGADESIPAINPDTAQPNSSGLSTPSGGRGLENPLHASHSHDLPISHFISPSNADTIHESPRLEIGLETSWLELGMDLGADQPIFSTDGIDPLQGFDIPFWLGQDNYATWMNS